MKRTKKKYLKKTKNKIYPKIYTKKGGRLLKNLLYRFGLQSNECKCCTWSPNDWIKYVSK